MGEQDTDKPFVGIDFGSNPAVTKEDKEATKEDKPEDDPEALAKLKIKERLEQLHAELEEARDGRTEDNIPVNSNEPYWDKRNALQRYLHELKG